MTQYYQVKLIPSEDVISLHGESSVFEQLKELGYPIKSSCGGCASCSLCIVKVIEGESNLNEMPFEESRLLGNVFHLTKERLSCQLRINGNITLDISNHLESESKKPLIRLRKSEEVRENSYKNEHSNDISKEANKPKRLGGGRRPKSFKFEDEE